MSPSIKELLESGVHFGHQTRFWNPQMAPFIYGDRNKIHIINLEKTVSLFEEALKFVRQLSARRGKILFVGTKRQAREIVKEEATRSGCAYVNYRWLGGTLTNFKTIKQSIKRLNDYESMIQNGEIEKFSKREALSHRREYEKLTRSIGGIKDIQGLPDAIFVIDVNHESGAVVEANKLGIPIIGVVDTNNSLEGVDYIIPGNDDSSRAILLYARNIADAVLEGRNQALMETLKAAKEEQEVHIN